MKVTTATYPRTFRNGHVITGPHQEKTSGHRQCLECRRESQDRARFVYAARWWMQECGFTPEHARAIVDAGERAFHDYLDATDSDNADSLATRAQDLAERAEARKYPEGEWRLCAPTQHSAAYLATLEALEAE